MMCILICHVCNVCNLRKKQNERKEGSKIEVHGLCVLSSEDYSSTDLPVLFISYFMHLCLFILLSDVICMS